MIMQFNPSELIPLSIKSTNYLYRRAAALLSGRRKEMGEIVRWIVNTVIFFIVINWTKWFENTTITKKK